MLGPPKRPLSHDMLHRLHPSSYAFNARAPSLAQEPLTYESCKYHRSFFSVTCVMSVFKCYLCAQRLMVPKLIFLLRFSAPFFVEVYSAPNKRTHFRMKSATNEEGKEAVLGVLKDKPLAQVVNNAVFFYFYDFNVRATRLSRCWRSLRLKSARHASSWSARISDYMCILYSRDPFHGLGVPR
jgi:hypothetical protein